MFGAIVLEVDPALAIIGLEQMRGYDASRRVWIGSLRLRVPDPFAARPIEQPGPRVVIALRECRGWRLCSLLLVDDDPREVFPALDRPPALGEHRLDLRNDDRMEVVAGLHQLPDRRDSRQGGYGVLLDAGDGSDGLLDKL